VSSVERSISITAGIQRVWDLVTRPGWWINDGEVTDHRIERDGDVCRVHDPACGEFEIRVVKLEPLSYAAFRWRSDGVSRSVDGPTTLVEFWLDDHGDGTVTVRVLESGFEVLDSPEDARRANDKGWLQELGALARALS
jgi:uncharacterized protein YndB with AHSA1/START domain